MGVWLERAAWSGVCAIGIGFAIAVGGPLDPPAGSIEPTLKTLDEVEPSTPIESLPPGDGARFLISEPGRYHLTGNLGPSGSGDAIIEIGTSPTTQVGIRGVTIDLRGFTIDGGFDAPSAVVAPNGASELVVRDGRLTRFSQPPIDAPTGAMALVEDLSLSSVGSIIGMASIDLGEGAVVRDLRVNGCGPIVVGDGSTVERVNATGSRALVRAGDGSRVVDVSWVSPPAGPPTPDPIVEVGDASTVERLTAIADSVGSTIPGVEAGEQATLRDCTFLNDGAGAYGPNTIVSVGSASVVEGVHITNWGRIGILTGARCEVRSVRCELSDSAQPTPGSSVGITCAQECIVESCVVHRYATGISMTRGRVSGCVVDLITDSVLGIRVSGGIIEDNVVNSLMDSSQSIVIAGPATVVRDNTILHQLGDVNAAIRASGSCEIRGNSVVGARILVIDAGTVVDDNTIVAGSNGIGISTTTTDTVVTRNRVKGPLGTYDVGAGNLLGTVQTSAVGAGPWDNFRY